MPRPKRGPRLGAGPAHQRLLLAGLAAQLFTHERVNTTQAKAKAVRPLAEKLIPDRDVVHKLFTDIGPRYAERPGGYTRILKLGARQGDGAPMARIELVASEE